MTQARSRGRRPGRGRGRGRDGFEDSPFEDHVVKIYRCAKVVKGGRRFRFAALVIVGDRKGQVGIGYGKANEVPVAVEKGIKAARKGLFTVPMKGHTLPHTITGRFGAAKVIMVPASEGTGVIAGVHLRPLLELAGIRDVLTKSVGSPNPKNLVKAGVNGLKGLRTAETIAKLRGVKLS